MTIVDTSTTLGAQAARRLEQDEVVWLTTVDPRGTPQPTPVWFWWDGAQIVVVSQPATAKLRNVAGHPAVALHFNSTPDGGDVVVLLGHVVHDPAGLHADERTRYDAKYTAGMSGLGMSHEQFHAEYSQVLRFTPTRLRGF